jgi:hypothetical protein
MSKLLRSNRVRGAALILGCVLTAGAAHDQVREPELSDSDAEAALRLAFALLEKDVAVGVVLDRMPVGTAGRGNAAPEAEPVVADVDAALAEFAGQVASVRARRTASGVVSLEPRAGNQCLVRLRGAPITFKGAGPAHEVVYRAYRTVMAVGTPYVPPGIVGSSTPDRSSESYRVEVAADVPRGTLEDVLNAIVLQVPGLGWAVIRDQPGPPWLRQREKCSIWLFTGQSWLQTGNALVP